MADNKNGKQKLFENADAYRSYLEEDEKQLQDVYDHLLVLQGLSDTQLQALSNALPGKGMQHYLIEHIANAISIQSQMQSVLKDKRSIKENALQLALKEANGEEIGDSAAILAQLQALVNSRKIDAKKSAADKTEKKMTKTDAELDAEIDKRLGNVA